MEGEKIFVRFLFGRVLQLEMNVTEDAELLRRFASKRAEDAFAELVKRHLNLVYSATLRQVGGDRQLAEEVTQSVFTDLARKAESLLGRESLAGWLYTSAHFAAAKVVRGEQRRRLREQEAHHMQETNASSGVELQWEHLQPVIDDAMHELPDADREAILQRYFDKKPFLQIGAKLGLTENAARMRVERALDKLRGILETRGVVSTSVALATVMGAHAVSAAPAALTATVIGTSLAAVTGGTTTAWNIFTAAKLKIAVPVACAITVVVALLVQNDALSQLRKENAALLARQQAMVDFLETAATSAADAEKLERLRREHLELLRQRGEVGRLRRELAENKIKPPAAALPNSVVDNPAKEESTQQINVKAQFVTGDEASLILLGLPLPGESSTRTIEADQTESLLKKIRQSKGIDYLSQLQVTTLSGRQAQISAAQSVTNNNTVKAIGPILDICPVMREDGHTIELRMIGRLEDTYQVGDDGSIRLPSMEDTNQITSCVLMDGQTVAVSKKAGEKRLVMFITPVLIDPAGNPLHAEIEKAALVEPKQVQQ